MRRITNKSKQVETEEGGTYVYVPACSLSTKSFGRMQELKLNATSLHCERDNNRSSLARELEIGEYGCHNAIVRFGGGFNDDERRYFIAEWVSRA